MKSNFFYLFLFFSIILVLTVFKIHNYDNKNITIETVENKTINLSIPQKATKCEVHVFNFTEIWNDIFNVSDEQKLISPEVIIKTVKFMIQEVNEDDPELISFVKTLIQPPSNKPISLGIQGRTDFSQIGQSKYIDSVLNQTRNGFFLETGGYDGETYSNTVFFELERNWTGLLIEPIPSLYRAILAKNRNIQVINACISGKRPSVAKFRIANAVSGRPDDMSDKHKVMVEHETGSKKKWVYVPCFPLLTIMKAINVKKIDFFSLDIEGGEWHVIESMNFKELDIETISLEWAANPSTTDLIKNKIIANNFTLLKKDIYDLYFKKNG